MIVIVIGVATGSTDTPPAGSVGPAADRGTVVIAFEVRTPAARVRDNTITPVVNPPQAPILGVGRCGTRPASPTVS
jgi:pyruvate/2-oxoglutarate dehydrogenase complex dihydrolipoamide acyltransferase (E2) component